MTDDIERITRGLTKAQQELLLDDYGKCAANYAPAKKLIERELANSRYTAMGSHRLILTPLGLQVRDYLKGNSHAE